MELSFPEGSSLSQSGFHSRELHNETRGLGVLLITILMANESWFLLSQNDAYQIAFYSTDGNAFHMRKLGNSWWYDALLTF
jgi:hypothetical protein